jgi:arylsulfatase A
VDAAFFNSSSGLRDGKGTLYEGGIRSPGIVRWKGRVKPGSTSQAITGFEDWMPTLLDLCGLKNKTPEGIDGVSFASLLRGDSQNGREFLYREFPNYGGQQCVRLGKWKYIRTGISGGKARKAVKASEELYDLENDPAETSNVLAAHPKMVAQMRLIAAREHQNSADFKFPALDQ